MQQKVSIVIPCYNKENHIRGMFDSLLAQKWDNIELILVNDGSTDGTREIITEYVDMFHARGFEVVVLDQENKGLPSAVYAGLLHVSGDYVCQVDADDDLDPAYVSTMAGWLAAHPEDSWVVCDMLNVYEDGTQVYRSYLNPMYPEKLLLSNYIRSFLLGKVLNTVHEYMVRVEYMKRSGLVDNYYSEMRRTQEPQWVIPLAISAGQLKYIAEPLYHYRQNADMMSMRKTAEDHREYQKQYYEVATKTIEHLAAENALKRDLFALARIYYCEQAIDNALWRHQPKEAVQWCEEFIRAYNASGLEEIIRADMSVTEKVPFSALTGYFTNKLIGFASVQKWIDPAGRIIAYAAYGKAATSIKASLLESDIRPDVFWDMSAYPGDACGGVPVVRPDFEGLTNRDTVFVLLKSVSIIKVVVKRLEATEARENIWYLSDVQDYLAKYYLEM